MAGDDKPMHSKAIEAAARAICETEGYAYWPDDNPSDGHYGKIAQAAIAAYLSAMEAEGWCFTPVEATDEMIGVYYEHCDLGGDLHQNAEGSQVADVYRAMLAARPNVKG